MIDKVPFLDLRAAYDELSHAHDSAYKAVMDSGWYILGRECSEFEREFAKYCGVKYCVGVANGLEALVLTLKAFRVGIGDEVIVPSNTYIATWLAVSMVGAKPIPVEPDSLTLNIDPLRLRGSITPRTKAIIPVHLYGRLANVAAMRAVAEEYGLVVIEDAAQAHGAMAADANKAGGLGHAAAFSFYPSKNLGALGDGGAVTTNSQEVAEQIALLRNYGSETRYHNKTKGWNSRLDELQAAFLRIRLKVLDEWNLRRRRCAEYYLKELADIEGLVLPERASADHVWHLFVVRHGARDKLRSHLENNGISTQIHYPIPPHLSEAYKELGFSNGDFPVAESAANTVLSLPIGPHLNFHQIQRVVDVIRQFCLEQSAAHSKG